MGRKSWNDNTQLTFLLLCLFVYLEIRILSKFSMGLLGLNLVQKYYTYFAIGLLIKEFKIMQKNKVGLDWGLVISGMLFLIFVYFWYRLPSKVPSDMIGIARILNNFESYRFLTTICGCTFFLLLYHKFGNIQDKCLSKLGKTTLSIYILNYPLIWTFQILLGKQVTLFKNALVSIFSVVVIVCMAECLHGVIIQRVYWIYDVPGGENRGGHAFKQTEEFIIAMSGGFDVVVSDGVNKKVFTLNRSYYGLYIPQGLWRDIENFSTNSLALEFASTKYDRSDYVESFEEYTKMKENGKI